MFNWLFRWFRRDVGGVDFYHPGEMAIYRYHNGTEVVRVDPLPLYRRVMDKGPELHADIVALQVPSKFTAKAYEDLLGNIREIFSVTEYDCKTGKGLTEAATADLLDHFLLYVEHNKKKLKQSSTAATAASPITGPSPGGGPLTGSSSDSGSAASGEPTSKPAPSPSESESCSV